MSYDFYLAVDVGAEELMKLSNFRLNYTGNVWKMYADAFENEQGIQILHDKQAKDCIPLLDKAIQNFRNKRKEYKEMEPSNGWGSYKEAKKVLLDLREWCDDAPMAFMQVSA